MDLNVLWYLLVGVLLIGYAILDGFDLGVGIMHLLSKSDHDRRISLNSIGPVWDGNEVWLITAGGALFAAFPEVYATAFSGFYIPFYLLLMALIFRAVSIEFRSKSENPRWRETFDIIFSLGSFLATFLFGVAIGNVIMGMKIGPDMEYAGTLLDQLNPYAVLVGIFNVFMFALHGSLYLLIKTEGDMHDRMRKWGFRLFYIFITFYLLITLVTLNMKPQMMANFSFGTMEHIGDKHPLITEHETAISVIAWTVAVLNFLAILNIHRSLVKGNDLKAFLSSALSMAALVSLFALGIFPNMIISSIDPTYSLDIYNASSTQKTLTIMTYVALIGIPFVLSYTITIYWVFRGKTVIDSHSY